MSDFSFEFRWRSSQVIDFPVKKSGVAQSTAGWDAYFTVKRSNEHADVQKLFQKTLIANVSAGIERYDVTPADGISDDGLRVTISPADYAALQPYLQYNLDADLKVVDATGKEYYLQSGTITVLPVTTRAPGA